MCGNGKAGALQVLPDRVQHFKATGKVWAKTPGKSHPNPKVWTKTPGKSHPNQGLQEASEGPRKTAVKIKTFKVATLLLL